MKKLLMCWAGAVRSPLPKNHPPPWRSVVSGAKRTSFRMKSPRRAQAGTAARQRRRREHPRLLNWPHEKMDRENSMRAIGLVLLSIAIMALLLTDADAKRRRPRAQGSQAA